MPKIAFFLALATASFAVAAQQAQPKQPPANGAIAPDKEIVERARADGAAGGTAPVPPEKRKAVGAGAGPHRHDITPSPQKLPKDEPVQPPK